MTGVIYMKRAINVLVLVMVIVTAIALATSAENMWKAI